MGGARLMKTPMTVIDEGDQAWASNERSRQLASDLETRGSRNNFPRS